MDKVTITKSYLNYGKGSPGYNYKIRARYNNRDLAYASWPCVSCPTLTGLFRDLPSAQQAYDDLQDGEQYSLDDLRPYFMEPLETYMRLRHLDPN